MKFDVRNLRERFAGVKFVVRDLRERRDGVKFVVRNLRERRNGVKFDVSSLREHFAGVKFGRSAMRCLASFVLLAKLAFLLRKNRQNSLSAISGRLERAEIRLGRTRRVGACG